MMHGSEWTLKYDEPEVENVTRGAATIYDNHVNKNNVEYILCLRHVTMCHYNDKRSRDRL